MTSKVVEHSSNHVISHVVKGPGPERERGSKTRWEEYYNKSPRSFCPRSCHRRIDCSETLRSRGNTGALQTAAVDRFASCRIEQIACQSTLCHEHVPDCVWHTTHRIAVHVDLHHSHRHVMRCRAASRRILSRRVASCRIASRCPCCITKDGIMRHSDTS